MTMSMSLTLSVSLSSNKHIRWYMNTSVCTNLLMSPNESKNMNTCVRIRIIRIIVRSISVVVSVSMCKSVSVCEFNL